LDGWNAEFSDHRLWGKQHEPIIARSTNEERVAGGKPMARPSRRKLVLTSRRGQAFITLATFACAIGSASPARGALDFASAVDEGNEENEENTLAREGR
jgi:hypothetical protein